MKIVPLSSKPSLNDIVGQLRNLADSIEKGEYGEVGALFALMPVEGEYPRVWGWGDVAGKNDPAIQFELAKMWLMKNLLRRG